MKFERIIEGKDHLWAVRDMNKPKNELAVLFLEAHQSGERSTFVDDAKWRQENASWLRRSRRVAYAIMDYMQDNGLSRNDVAEKLGVSPQYVSKILSGKVNFSFKTISEIEECLGIEVFQAAAMEA